MTNWIVSSKFTTRSQMEEYFGDDAEMYAIDDINECEIAIVKEDYRLGLDSYGWDNPEKKIIVAEGCTLQKEVNSAIEKAEKMCRALNE